MKRKLLGTLIATALLAGSGAASAGDILIDRNGGAAGGVITASTIDPTPGNFLAVNVLGNEAGPWWILGQSRVGFQDTNGNPVGAVPGTEWTMQFRVPIVVDTTNAPGSINLIVTEDLDLDGTVTAAETAEFFDPTKNFMKMWYDDSPDSVDLTDSGFDDGTLVLSAQFVPYEINSDISATIPAEVLTISTQNNNIVNLDQFGANNFPGPADARKTKSLGGNTPLSLDLIITAVNEAFFPNKDLLVGAGIADFIISNVGGNSPFTTVNPGTTVMGETIDYALLDNPAVPGILIQKTNALECPAPQVNCDVHLSMDSSIAFNTSNVPAPGSLALLGLGLSALALGGRRRRRG